MHIKQNIRILRDDKFMQHVQNKIDCMTTFCNANLDTYNDITSNILNQNIFYI